MSKVDRLLRDIEREVEYTRRVTGKTVLAPRVMAAMAKVPRHEFVPDSVQHFAYENGPLSIGYGQTISQPFIVALMTDLLNPQPDSVMLEVGAGSGYQSAVLSLLVRQIYTIEIVPELASQAAERLKRLGYANVEVQQGDGYFGYPEHAPYDGIIVTAAAPTIPPPLIEQLKPGARLVIPVGSPFFHQELMLIEKNAAGEVTTRDVLSVAFVPLTRDHNSRTDEKNLSADFDQTAGKDQNHDI